tara:strand:+ start:584 stop:1801 length:1218 start_codon:yes stop_codon:yes gene_type:complete
MGAGSREDHYIQDATEQDLVYRLQKLLVDDNLAVTNDWEKKKKKFDKRLVKGEIVKKYPKSDQAKCIDRSFDLIYQQLKNYRPNIKFDVVWIGRDGRNESKKGDFILVYEDGKEISFSLKVYVGGYATIQVCSGTFNSTFLKLVLMEYALPAVGMYKNPIPREEWKEVAKREGMTYYHRRNYKEVFSGGKSLAVRDVVLKYLGLDSAVDTLHALDQVKEDSIARFRDDPHMRNWYNVGVKETWEDQCKIAGNAGASLVCNYLKESNVDVKSWFLKQVGLSGGEELLAISKKDHLLSTHNEKYKDVVSRALSEESFVEYCIKGKGIEFTLKDSSDILSINVPFTLNKNGAWWVPKKGDEFEGKMPYPGSGKDSGTMLSCGEWRPEKAQEMATSTNTHVNLGQAGIC